MYGSWTENVVLWRHFLGSLIIKNKKFYTFFRRRYLLIHKIDSENITTQMDDFESRLCAET